MSKRQRWEYRNMVTKEMDDESFVGAALYHGRLEAREEGHEEGLKEGIQKQQIETARKMLGKGYSVEEIVDCTGISIEDLAALTAANAQ